MHRKNNLLKTAGIMMVIMLVGKVMGLWRDVMFASYYGTASAEGTAFNIASLIPRQLLDIMFASVISASFIPVFNDRLEKSGRPAAFDLAHNFISVILAFSTLVTAVCILFSTQILNVLAGGLAPDALRLANALIRIMFPIIILSGAAFSITGILQSMGEFNIPAAMSVVSNGIIIVYFLFFIDRLGVYGLCAAYLLGWGSQIVIQIPFLIKNKFRFKFFINLRDEGFKQILRLMLPVMISTWVAPINILVNVKAAARLYDGKQGPNALTYANTLYTVITGVFILSIANVIFPELSKLTANNDDESFGDVMQSTVRNLIFMLVPMTFGLLALCTPIVRIYERNEFTAASTLITSKALFFFAFGICGFGLQTILSRGFYACKDGKTPLFTGILAIVLNAVLSFTLVNYLEVGGPALASSVSITVSSAVMLYIMYRKNKRVLNAAVLWDGLKILGVSAVMYIVAVFVRDFLSGMLADSGLSRLIVISAAAFVGVCVYAAGTFLLKIREAVFVYDRLLKRKTQGD